MKLTIFYQFNLKSFHKFISFIETDDATMALETAKEAIDTAADALNVFNKTFGQSEPWKCFEEAEMKFKRNSGQYSSESARYVGKLTTQLLIIIDGHFSATQSINGWCDYAINILKTYINLFNDGNASNQMAQKNFLLETMENLKQNIETAMAKFEICVENLKTTSETLMSLGTQFCKDFEEKIRRGSDNKNALTKMRRWCTCCCGGGSKTVNPDELKQNFNSMQQFHENLKVQVDQTIIDIEHAKEQFLDKILVIDEQISRVSETKTYDVDDDVVELRDCVIESANNLIANCNEYVNNNKSTQKCCK